MRRRSVGDYGGQAEAKRLRHYGYPSPDDEPVQEELYRAHERAEHLFRPNDECEVCRYTRRWRVD